jgi:hypothetical protein
MSQSKKAFTAACKEFFGFKPGQTLREFGEELKALTFNDKMELASGLRLVGIDCADPINYDVPASESAHDGPVAVAA